MLLIPKMPALSSIAVLVNGCMTTVYFYHLFLTKARTSVETSGETLYVFFSLKIGLYNRFKCVKLYNDKLLVMKIFVIIIKGSFSTMGKIMTSNSLEVVAVIFANVLVYFHFGFVTDIAPSNY